MAEKHELGIKGEQLAAEYLANKGYKILETNWRSGHKEIDLIAYKDETIIVVEVKSRSNTRWEEPQVAVNRQKQRLLVYAADSYINAKGMEFGVRFDIITVVGVDENAKIEHLEDAFYPTLR